MSNIKVINRIAMVAGVTLVTLAIFVQILLISLAGGESKVKVIQLGTAGIANPEYTDEDGMYEYSMVYYGSWSADESEAEPVLWRVLDADAEVTSADGDEETTKNAMFLLSEYILDIMKFGSNNTWSESDVLTWCNNFASGSSAAFSAKELAAIVSTNKSETYNDNPSLTDTALTGEKVFLLSVLEVENYLGEMSGRIAYMLGADTNEDSENGWWLRTAIRYGTSTAAAVFSFGDISASGDEISETSNGVRPAFNLDLSAVLFTSAAEGGKSLTDLDEEQVGSDAIYEIEEDTVDAWKITLLDDDRKFKITDSKAYAAPGSTITLGYTAATTGTFEYISVIIAETQEDCEDVEGTGERTTGDIIYYGRVADLSSADADGTVEITVPSDLTDGIYTLYVFNEQYNGDYNTDYASEFSEVELNVDSNLPVTISDSNYTNYTSYGLTSENYTDYLGYYAITSADELMGFAKMVNEYGITEANALMLCDINMNGYTWTPIGSDSSPYTGTFDGGEHTIKNLVIVEISDAGIGLFRNVADATIKNLTLDSTCTLSSAKSSVGGIVCYATSVTLINCTNCAIVQSDSGSAGGLVACAGYVALTNCKNTRIVTNVNGSAGGLVGTAVSAELTDCVHDAEVTADYGPAGGMIASAGQVTLTNCENYESVTSWNDSAGGLVGTADSAELINCVNYAGVESYAQSAGGLVGTATTATLTKCTNSGWLRSPMCTGGLVGETGTTITVQYCANLEEIRKSNDVETDRVGGLIGYINGDGEVPYDSFTIKILDSYNTGSVEGNAKVGGLIGCVLIDGCCAGTANITIANCYSKGEVSCSSGSCGELFGECEISLSEVDEMTESEANVSIDNIYYLTGEDANYYGALSVQVNSKDCSIGATAVTSEQFKSGEICYLLNGSSSKEGVIWGQTINEYNGDESPMFNKDTFGEDTVLLVAATVYGNKSYYCNGVDYYAIEYSNEEGGTTDAHELTPVSKEASTCTEAGNIAHYQCSACLALFEDEDAKTSLTEEQVTVVATGHSWDDCGFCNYCSYYQPAVLNKEDNCYEIKNEGQFLWFAAMVNADSTRAEFEESDPGANGKLTLSIDLSNQTCTPIGSSDRPYTGTFDGAGYTVSGLCIINSDNYVGLFGYISGATIKNLTLTGSIGGSYYVGSIAGYSYNSTVSNCLCNVTVNGGNCAGGIVGYSDDSSFIYCVNKGKVVATCFGGGIVGRAMYGLNICYCINEGSISGDYLTNIGGLVGYMVCDLDFSEETLTVNITDSYNTGTISGGIAGGLIGSMLYSRIYATISITISDCYSIGEMNDCVESYGKLFGVVEIYGTQEGKEFAIDTSNLYYAIDDASNVQTDTSYYGRCSIVTEPEITLTATPISTSAFTTGEACYIMNGSSSADGVIWGQTLGEDGGDANPVFNVNTLGTDTVLSVGETVYYTAYYTCAGENYKNAYTNLGETCTDAHKLNPLNAEDPTCTETGNTAHYQCSVCSALFEDKDAQKELTKEDVTIAALEHSWSITEYDWADDGSYCDVTVECSRNSKHTYTFTVYAEDDTAGEEIEEPVEEVEEEETFGLSIDAQITSEVSVEATCTEIGTTKYTISGTITCEKVNDETPGVIYISESSTDYTTKEVNDIPATGHSWSITGYTWKNGGATCEITATCGINGCGETKTFTVNSSDESKNQTDETLGLTLSAEISSKTKDGCDPTCTKMGTTVYTVSGTLSYTKDGEDTPEEFEVFDRTEEVDIAALGHTTVTDSAVAATCTETGLTAGSHCSVCGEILVAQETIAALDHDYSSEITTAATCTKDGVKTYSCNRCEASYTEAVAATGHTTVADSAIAATCTTTGLTAGSHCSVCNEILAAQETIAATGHTYTGVITAATTETEGYTTYTCAACGDTYISDYTDLLTSDIYITETVSDSLSPSVDLADSEEVKSALIMEELSEEIQQAIITGEDVYVHLEVTTIDETALTEEEIALVAEILGEDIVGTYLDFSIWVQCGEYSQKATLLADGINLMISIPDELINIDASYNRTYYIIRIHEGVAERIDGTFDEESGQFVFQTECFSTYILAYTDVEVGSSVEDENPKEAELDDENDEEVVDEEIEEEIDVDDAVEEIIADDTTAEDSEFPAPQTGENAFYIWLIAMLSAGVAVASCRRYKLVR